MKPRKIQSASKSVPTIEGAGVRLKRAFGFRENPKLDPFLLLDDFHSKDPKDYSAGFPWHPHRGIETITYMLHGEIKHGDSMGNEGIITPGDVQWMTAGSGIIHQEMPASREKDRHMWGFQLWANLPHSHKMRDPRYRGVEKKDIPEVTLDNGIKVKIICGIINGVKGPIQDIITDPEYLDITMLPKTSFTHEVHPDHTVCVYTIDGKAYFDGVRDPFGYEMQGAGWWTTERDCQLGKETLIIYGEGDHVKITTDKDPTRFLFLSGKPIKENVAWYGPIVMNTQEELRVAFEEYQNGTFIKKPGKGH